MEIIQDLEKQFDKARNPADAASMSAYMKHHFSFFGIKHPVRRAIFKEVLSRHEIPNKALSIALLKEMFVREEREWHHCGIELFLKQKKHWVRRDITIIEWMVVNRSWWDSVDMISTNICGPFLQKFPDLLPEYPDAWIMDQNLWLRRMALLFQLKYKEALDFDLLSKYILFTKNSKEFFIEKAAGWVLREHSKRYPEQVKDFVNKHPELNALTKREALRLLNNKH